MNWVDIIKAVKCPECGKKAFSAAKIREPKYTSKRYYAQHAVYQCSECGYSEVI